MLLVAQPSPGRSLGQLIEGSSPLLLSASYAAMHYGVYSSNYNLLDLQVMIIFGIIGYFMKKSDYPGAPLLLGLVLGPMFENALDNL